jgi:hypothetical protein
MKMSMVVKGFILISIITAVVIAAGASNANLSQDPKFLKNRAVLWPMGSNTDQMLDETFRIDIQAITVTFDYFPGDFHADCQARVEFVMRPGQQVPVIHLGPAVRDPSIVNQLQLNGETLDITNESQVRVVSFDGTRQQALEFQRQLDSGSLHVLEVSYRLNMPAGYPRFSTEVNDLEGRGNEELFPTINVPHDLAMHNITFRVHSNNPFRCIGSGLVTKTDDAPGIQQWTLDTEREVASYTVMFVLMPAADTWYEERTINGVDVRMMAFRGGAHVTSALDVLENWLPELADVLGPFPMPRGLSVFLVSRGGGMEYYGATITSAYALEHEVFHMYYGCSTVNKTYRDSWLDEAVNQWYENSAFQSFAPIEGGYTSNIVSGRSPVAVGFDRRAYGIGSRILEAVATDLGGRSQMIGFLRYLHLNYSFAPFTTLDFLDYLEEYSGVDLRSSFAFWLYTDESQDTANIARSAGQPSRNPAHEKEPDLTPPPQILKKYGIK